MQCCPCPIVLFMIGRQPQKPLAFVTFTLCLCSVFVSVFIWLYWLSLLTVPKGVVLWRNHTLSGLHMGCQILWRWRHSWMTLIHVSNPPSSGQWLSLLRMTPEPSKTSLQKLSAILLSAGAPSKTQTDSPESNDVAVKFSSQIYSDTTLILSFPQCCHWLWSFDALWGKVGWVDCQPLSQ